NPSPSVTPRDPPEAGHSLHGGNHVSPVGPLLLGSRRDGDAPQPRARSRLRLAIFQAERAGFEPATHLAARTRFPVALLRPLGHLSGPSQRIVVSFAPGPSAGRKAEKEGFEPSRQPFSH